MSYCIEREQLRFHRLSRYIADLDPFWRRGQLRLDFGNIGARPRQRIEDHQRHALAFGVDVRGNLTQRSLRDIIRGPVDIFQIALCLKIIHRDARPRHDVVEVIEQQVLPDVLDPIRRIAASVKSAASDANVSAFCTFSFRTRNSALGLGLRVASRPGDTGSTVHRPRRKPPVGKLLLHVVEEVTGKNETPDRGIHRIRSPALDRMIQHARVGPPP